MDTAEMLYTRNASDPEEVQRRRPGYPWGNELNVAAVCAGYAFELIFKVMVRVRGGQPEPKHEPSEAYRKLAELAPVGCTEVKLIITSHGWKDASEFLTYLDEHLCDKDRKYWIKPPKGGAAGATPICPTGPFSMPPTGCRTAFVWPWPEAGRVGRVRSCRRLTSPRAQHARGAEI